MVIGDRRVREVEHFSFTKKKLQTLGSWVVRAAFDLMGVITFYTAGDTESRAWIVPRKTRAVKAAGTIHSDMERGFIRAEVVHYDVLVREGSWNACRDKGLLRLEGKDYPIAEADVVYFRFNV